MYSLIKYYLFGDTSENNNNDNYAEESKAEESKAEESKVLHLLKDPTNFYYLSLINEADNTWSIHGLWPQYKTNQYPTFCKNIKFNIAKIKTIINDLEKYWYSKGEKDEKFWEHEYLKHGTCNFNNLDELSYFNTTLELFQKAVDNNLPEQFYNENTKKCLIPVNQKLDFFIVEQF
tara:strand:- start:2124 stop:2651 length:528 start_codon:yes stop_codon:yes gene_type:complete